MDKVPHHEHKFDGLIVVLIILAVFIFVMVGWTRSTEKRLQLETRIESLEQQLETLPAP